MPSAVPHIARSIAPAISDVVQAANIPIQSRWLLASGPNPLLAISGEHGSAKTVLSKMLKALIDPNVAPVRALPREERELMIAANNDPLAFDNLSDCPSGSRMRYVGSRAGAASQSGSSILTMMRSYFRRPARCS